MAEMATRGVVKSVYPWVEGSADTECMSGLDLISDSKSTLYTSNSEREELFSMDKVQMQLYLCKSETDKTPITHGLYTDIIFNKGVTVNQVDVYTSKPVKELILPNTIYITSSDGRIRTATFNKTNLDPNNAPAAMAIASQYISLLIGFKNQNPSRINISTITHGAASTINNIEPFSIELGGDFYRYQVVINF